MCHPDLVGEWSRQFQLQAKRRRRLQLLTTAAVVTATFGWLFLF